MSTNRVIASRLKAVFGTFPKIFFSFIFAYQFIALSGLVDLAYAVSCTDVISSQTTYRYNEALYAFRYFNGKTYAIALSGVTGQSSAPDNYFAFSPNFTFEYVNYGTDSVSLKTQLSSGKFGAARPAAITSDSVKQFIVDNYGALLGSDKTLVDAWKEYGETTQFSTIDGAPLSYSSWATVPAPVASPSAVAMDSSGNWTPVTSGTYTKQIVEFDGQLDCAIDPNAPVPPPVDPPPVDPDAATLDELASYNGLVCMGDINNDGELSGPFETGKCETTAQGNLCPVGALDCNTTYQPPVCPSGSVINTERDMCQKDPDQVNCPTGYTWDQTIDKCVLYPPCGDGGTYNGTTDRCEKLVQNDCPTGYTLDATLQVCQKAVVCPDGGTYNASRDRCEFVAWACPAGLTYNSSLAICQAAPYCSNGWSYNTTRNRCEKAPDACPVGYSYNTVINDCVATPTCASGGVLNGTSDKCEITASISCNVGWTYNSSTGKCEQNPTCTAPGTYSATYNVCLAEVTGTSCPTGYSYNSTYGKCVASPICVGGSYSVANNRCEAAPSYTCSDASYTYNSSRGRCEKAPVCPSGMTYNATYNVCTQAIIKSCPTGYTYNATRNRCEYSPPTCPSGTTYNASTNRCEANPACETGLTYNPSTNQCEGGGGGRFCKSAFEFSCDTATDPSCYDSIYVADGDASVFASSGGVDGSCPSNCASPTWHYLEWSGSIYSVYTLKYCSPDPCPGGGSACVMGEYAPSCPAGYTSNGTASCVKTYPATLTSINFNVPIYRLGAIISTAGPDANYMLYGYAASSLSSVSSAPIAARGDIVSVRVETSAPTFDVDFGYASTTKYDSTWKQMGLDPSRAAASLSTSFSGWYLAPSPMVKSGYTCQKGDKLSGTTCTSTVSKICPTGGELFNNGTDVFCSTKASAPYCASGTKVQHGGADYCETTYPVANITANYNLPIYKSTDGTSLFSYKGTGYTLYGYASTSKLFARTVITQQNNRLLDDYHAPHDLATFGYGSCDISGWRPIFSAYDYNYGENGLNATGSSPVFTYVPPSPTSLTGYQCNDYLEYMRGNATCVQQFGFALSCNVGDVALGGVCIPNSTSAGSSGVACPVGSTLDSTSDKCTANPTCNNGGSFDGTNDVCYVVYTPACSQGTYDSVSGLCTTSATCSNGTLDNTVDICYQAAASGCPSGYTLSGSVCIATPTCTTPGAYNSTIDYCSYSATFTCPSGYTYSATYGQCYLAANCNGGGLNTATDKCEMVYSYSCPSGYTTVGSLCQAAPSCATGGVYNGSINLCDSSTAVCSTGSLDTSVDFCYQAASCAGGALNTTRDMCEATATPSCGTYTWDSTNLICYSTPICDLGSFQSVRDRCEAAVTRDCGTYTWDEGVQKCLQNVTCPTSTPFTTSLAADIDRCVGTPDHVCATGLTWNGQPVMQCEAVPVCSGAVYYDPVKDQCLQSVGCPYGSEYSCMQNTSGVFQCSPYPCVDVSAGEGVELEPFAEDYFQDDGPRDAQGNCLGQVYIFTGKPSRCRPEGWTVGFANDCCADGDAIPEDTGNAAAVISGAYSIYSSAAAVQSAYSAYNSVAASTEQVYELARLYTNAVESGASDAVVAGIMEGGNAAISGASQSSSMLAAGIKGLGPAVAIYAAGAVTEALGGDQDLQLLASSSATLALASFALLSGPQAAIGIAVMVAMRFVMGTGCDANDIMTSNNIESDRCHYVGKYCEKKILGMCVQKAKGYCCFNSILARIIHEQGRPQLISFQPDGAWGSAKRPNCKGFTPEEFQSVDFAKIDMTEYYGQVLRDIEEKVQGATERVDATIKERFNQIQNSY